MSIYQSQYLFMKQHFYQQETDELPPDADVAPEKKKKDGRLKDKRRKKRRWLWSCVLIQPTLFLYQIKVAWVEDA